MFRRTESHVPTLYGRPFASGIPTRELAIVDTISTPVRIPAGRAAIVENAVGRECMLVVEGSFTVERGGEPIGRLEPGDFMGEVALLAKQPRNATVTAAEDSVVYAFTPREFDALLRECPTLAARVLGEAANRGAAAAVSVAA